MHEHMWPQSRRTQSIMDSIQILHKSLSLADVLLALDADEVGASVVAALGPVAMFELSSFSRRLFSACELYKRRSLLSSSAFSQQPLYSTKLLRKISLICLMLSCSMSLSDVRSEMEARRLAVDVGAAAAEEDESGEGEYADVDVVARSGMKLYEVELVSA